MKLEAEHYYRPVIPLGDPSVLVPHDDVVEWPVDLALYEEDVLLCQNIGSRPGRLGRWAGLIVRRGSRPIGFFLRVSKNHIPSGHWAPVPPLEVLALASAGRV